MIIINENGEIYKLMWQWLTFLTPFPEHQWEKWHSGSCSPSLLDTVEFSLAISWGNL